MIQWMGGLVVVYGDVVAVVVVVSQRSRVKEPFRTVWDTIP